MKDQLTRVQRDDGRTWGKSSYSGDNGGNCLSVTIDPNTGLVASDPDTGLIGVWDTKTGPTGPIQWVTPQAWSAFSAWIFHTTR
jgi:hypothetical protein